MAADFLLSKDTSYFSDVSACLLRKNFQPPGIDSSYTKLTVTSSMSLLISPSLTEEIKTLLPVLNPGAQLETLTLDIRLQSPVYGRPRAGPFFDIWLLSALAALLPASTTAVKELSFYFPRYSAIEYYSTVGPPDPHIVYTHEHINPLNRTIPFPTLCRLKTCVQKGCLTAFNSFMDVNKATVEELDLQDTGDLYSEAYDRVRLVTLSQSLQ
ncbi:hypothetical protein TWF281_002808 [Arthrobotrys megalospora]